MDSCEEDPNSVAAGLRKIREALLNSRTSGSLKTSSPEEASHEKKPSWLTSMLNTGKPAKVDREEEAKSDAHLPGWTHMSIWQNKTVANLTSFLFDPYVVIVVNDWNWYNDDEVEDNPKLGDDKDVTLVAIDLRDNSVQETQIHDRSFFYDDSKVEHCPYTLNKYGDNQIIRYGMAEANAPLISLLTIESFERIPFKVKCENIVAKGTPQKDYHTAQIYNDSLYVFGGRAWRFFTGELWKFDLKNHTWEELKLENGPRSTWGTGSFLYEDNLYVYGLVSFDRENPIFALNLKTMSWSKVSQKDWEFIRKDDFQWKRLDKSIYDDNLLFMKYHSNQLQCWNMKTNSLRTFKIRPIRDGFFFVSDAFVYKNRLWAFEGGYSTHILDLEEIGLRAEETEEEKQIKGLFMKEEGSDLKLRVQDKLIPAHKEVLIQRSKYFAGLFNSGMSESRESVIEIQDCESDLFQEFLRYLYTREIELNDDLAMKLIVLADKYVQADLSEKCFDFLKFTMKSDNVYKILDFASQQNLDQLKKVCKNFLKSNIDVKNLSRLIQYVEKQPDQDSQEIKSAATNFIVNKFQEVYKEDAKNWQFYEDFLIRNVEMDTISFLVNFIYWKHSDLLETNEKEDFEGSEEEILQNTLRLKQACFDFAEKNFKQIHQKGIAVELPNKFLVDLALSAIDSPPRNQ